MTEPPTPDGAMAALGETVGGTVANQSTCPGWPLKAGGSRPARVLNIAHRGARAFAAENTLLAIAKAGELGCEMVELDVHLSADDELVVVHDDDLRRCSNVASRYPGRPSYRVGDFTAAEIAGLDAGSWYIEQLALPPQSRQGFLQTLTAAEMAAHISPAIWAEHLSGQVRIPTLQQALATAAQWGLLTNIELKSLPGLYPGLAAKVVGLVGVMGLRERVVISSFDHETLVEVRRHDRQVATAVLDAQRLAHPVVYVRDLLQADGYNPGCVGECDSVGLGSLAGRVDPTTVARWASLRAAGLAIHVWTENEPARMAALVAAGVTGVFTDYPNRLAEVLAREGIAGPDRAPSTVSFRGR